MFEDFLIINAMENMSEAQAVALIEAQLDDAESFERDYALAA